MQTEKRLDLIDREKVYENACAGCTRHGEKPGECYHDEPCERLIIAFTVAEPVDAAEVVHGYWINTPPYRASNGNYNKAQECSVCHALFVSPGNTPYSNHPFCCECGAKMDGDGNG